MAKRNFSDTAILDKGAELFLADIQDDLDMFYRGFITKSDLMDRIEAAAVIAETRAASELQAEADENADEAIAEMAEESA